MLSGDLTIRTTTHHENRPEKRPDPTSSLASQIATQTLSEIKEANNQPLKNKFAYRFPENSIFNLNTGKTINISGIEIDLCMMYRGGFGFGSKASSLLAQAMQAIGHSTSVCNLPYTIDAVYDYNKLQIVSLEDEIVPPSDIVEIINDFIGRGFTHVNIPINLGEHTSLASILFSEQKTAFLRFYDSYSPEARSYYDERYHMNSQLIDLISELLPDDVHLERETVKVLHLLDQGTGIGCGYYSLYTALLLKDDSKFRNLSDSIDTPLFNQSHDNQIRAELVIRTLLTFGTENVIIDRWHEQTDGIFNRIGNSELTKLIEKLNHLTSG